MPCLSCRDLGGCDFELSDLSIHVGEVRFIFIYHCATEEYPFELYPYTA